MGLVAFGLFLLALDKSPLQLYQLVYEAASGLVQRRMDLPDATVLVLRGFVFAAIVPSETLGLVGESGCGKPATSSMRFRASLGQVARGTDDTQGV